MTTKPGEPMEFLLAVLTTNPMGCPGRDRLGSDMPPWPYSVNNNYPRLQHVDGRSRYVHELVCEWWHGPRPSPLHVASHLCGNGHLGCYAPVDLKWQTRAEDQADRARHGTGAEWVTFACPQCGTEVTKRAKDVRSNRKQGKAGPFCSPRCAASWAWRHR